MASYNQFVSPLAALLSAGSFRVKYTVSQDDFKKPLGAGGFGTVYKCTNRRLETEAAVKVVNLRGKPPKDQDSISKQVFKEVEIMKELKGGPYILGLEDFYEEYQRYLIVTELCTGGELFYAVEKYGRGGLDVSNVTKVTKQLLEALEYCHHKHIVHCDIKEENIMLVRPWEPESEIPDIKLIDFGLSQKITKDKKLVKVLGTPSTMAPEVWDQTGFDEKADIWSVGCVMYTLLTGVFAVDYEKPLAVLKANKKNPARRQEISPIFDQQVSKIFTVQHLHRVLELVENESIPPKTMACLDFVKQHLLVVPSDERASASGALDDLYLLENDLKRLDIESKYAQERKQREPILKELQAQTDRAMAANQPTDNEFKKAMQNLDQTNTGIKRQKVKEQTDQLMAEQRQLRKQAVEALKHMETFKGKLLDRIRHLKTKTNVRRFIDCATNLLRLDGDHPVLVELTRELFRGNEQVSIDTFVQTLARLMTRPTEGRYEPQIQEQIGIYVRALDLDGDEEISRAEFLFCMSI